MDPTRNRYLRLKNDNKLILDPCFGFFASVKKHDKKLTYYLFPHKPQA